jgi:hypothetical protein
LNQNSKVYNSKMAVDRVVRLLLFSVAAIIFHGLAATSVSAQASDIYITPDGAGNGICTSNTHPPSWFNNSGNWGTGGSQIGPGTIVHLCGTFTGAAGSGLLSAQGNGTSSAPITILFETGANLTSPAWVGNENGAINISAHSYIIVDGGQPCGWVNNALVACNGTIQNTSAGTNFTTPNGAGNTTGNDNPSCTAGTSGSYCFTSNAIFAGDAGSGACQPGCEIRNLTIQNLYVHVGVNCVSGPIASCNPPVDVNVDQTEVNGIDSHGAAGILIHNNVITNVGWAINVGYSGSGVGGNVQVYNNYVNNMDHGVVAGNYNGNATGYSFHDNYLGNMSNWDTGSCTGCNPYHHDGIHVWTGNPYFLVNLSEYNNTFGGTPGVNANAFIYAEGSSQNLHVFNNYFNGSVRQLWVMVNSCSPSPCTTSTGTVIANNTLVNTSQFAVMTYGTNTGTIFKNNVMSNNTTFDQLANSTSPTVDYNYHELGVYTGNYYWYNTTYKTGTDSFSAWQGSGFDTHGIYNSTSTRYVNSNGTLATGAPAINTGANLTSLGITALDRDINGNPRPASGNWTMGAYNSGAAQASIPAPTDLKATVQ